MEKFKGFKHYIEVPEADVSTMQEDILKRAETARGTVLCGVIDQVLGPDWTEEQAKGQFSIVTREGQEGREWVAYQGTVLGELKLHVGMNHDFQTVVSYTFIPSKQFR